MTIIRLKIAINSSSRPDLNRLKCLTFGSFHVKHHMLKFGGAFYTIETCKNRPFFKIPLFLNGHISETKNFRTKLDWKLDAELNYVIRFLIGIKLRRILRI